jgi:hypothetical protein
VCERVYVRARTCVRACVNLCVCVCVCVCLCLCLCQCLCLCVGGRADAARWQATASGSDNSPALKALKNPIINDAASPTPFIGVGEVTRAGSGSGLASGS